MRKTAVVALLCVVALPLLAACGSVDARPFEEFSKSTTEIRTNADRLLEESYGMSRDRTMRKAASTEPSVVGKVIGQLTVRQAEDEDGKVRDYAWKIENPPLFLAIRKFRSAVNDFNAILSTYAASLADLAGPVALSSEQMEEMAGALNTEARAAAGALKLDVRQDKLALFSTVAVAIFKQYLVSKQRSHLQEALAANQGWIEEIARLGQGAARNMAVIIWQEFLTLQDKQLPEIASASASVRKGLVKAKIDHNERLIDYLEALRTLDEAYAVLPRAHADLAQGLKVDYFSLAYVRNLFGLAKRLQRLQQKLAEE